MSDLAQFLLDRIAEDAMIALKAAAEWHEQDWVEIDAYPQEHVFRHDPASVLAGCNVKRRIVELHWPQPTARALAEGEAYESCPVCDPYPPMEEPNPGACDTLRLLALPYADHPDYRQEWKP